MSPPKNHTDADAKATTVRLTPLDYEAIHEIGKFQQARGNDRTRKNDILVDALRHFLQHITGKTVNDLKELMPAPQPTIKPQSKVTEMPKKKR